MIDTWNPWNCWRRYAASSFWPMLAQTSEYTTSAPLTASLGLLVISILPIPVLLAFSTVSLSGSNPFGHAQTKWKGTTEANRSHECTMLFPSPTYTTCTLHHETRYWIYDQKNPNDCMCTTQYPHVGNFSNALPLGCPFFFSYRGPMISPIPSNIPTSLNGQWSYFNNDLDINDTWTLSQ